MAESFVRIVTTRLLLAPRLMFVGLRSRTLKLSLSSATRSLRMTTLKDLFVSPATKLNVPLVAM